MVAISVALRLSGTAIGTVGALLLFVEFFQVPSYLSYKPDRSAYKFNLSPPEINEYTWFARTGALLLALSFALQFLAEFL